MGVRWIARAALATAVSLAYGASVEPLVGPGAPWRLLTAVTAGWIVSLAVLIPMSQRPAREVLDHGTWIMALGVAPLVPLAAANFVSPALLPNVVVLAADGLLMLGTMIARLRQTWNAVVWFAVLEAGGLLTWRLA